MQRFWGDVGLFPGDRRRAIYPKTRGSTGGWAELRTLGGQGRGVICHLAVYSRQAAVVEAVGHAEALGRRLSAVHLKTQTHRGWKVSWALAGCAAFSIVRNIIYIKRW